MTILIEIDVIYSTMSEVDVTKYELICTRQKQKGAINENFNGKRHQDKNYSGI
jgi:hypothetical protein